MKTHLIYGIEVTDRILNIPMALANRYGRPGTLRYDEMVSFGNLALMAAVKNWNPNMSSLSSHVFRCVAWQYVSYIKGTSYRKELQNDIRWGKIERLTDIDLNNLKDSRNGNVSVENKDCIEYMLKFLSVEERQLINMIYFEEMPLREIARRRKISLEGIRNCLKSIMMRLKAIMNAPCNDTESYRYDGKEKESPIVRDRMYLVDESKMEVTGPFRNYPAALCYLGVPYKQPTKGSNKAKRLLKEALAERNLTEVNDKKAESLYRDGYTYNKFKMSVYQ